MYSTISVLRNVLAATTLALGLAVSTPTNGDSISKRPDRVAVSCDTEGTEILDQVCSILIGILNDAGYTDVVFVADDGARDAAVRIRLETTIAGKSILKGRLRWWRSRDGAESVEPEVTLTVSDGELTAWTVGNFVRALIKVSDLPFGE